ncbi:hypothetical protein C8R44DRAFT_629864, partial [Mycena epipterygia]
CARWYTIVSGDGCGKLETTFNLTQAELFALNPELAPSCTNLALDEAYCVRAIPGSAPPPTGPPADLNPGSWSNACSKIYTVVSGDSCGAVETKAAVTAAKLQAENTWINAACSSTFVPLFLYPSLLLLPSIYARC